MKLLLFISFIGFSLTLFAQITKEDLQKKLQDAIKNRNPNEKTFSLPQFPLIKQEQKNLQGYINGQQVTAGIYNLSLDGMPCVVPDTNGIAAMPNVFPNVSVPFKTTIPNATPVQPLLDPNRKWSK